MNFSTRTRAARAFGYPIALGLMVALGVSLWLLFRRNRWM